MNHFVLADKTIGLSTNLPEFKWSFGITAPDATAEQYEACALKLHVNVTDDQQFADSEMAGRYHYFSSRSGSDRIRYRRRFLMSQQLLLDAKGLVDNQPSFQINRTYHRRIHHRFMNLHSPAYLLTDTTAFCLLRLGYAALHCSAFATDDACVLVLAPPNTGKTLTTMQICMQHGADYLAEDLAVTDGRDLIGVPWTSTFRYYDGIDRRSWGRWVNAATRFIPALELLPMVAARPITDYLPNSSRVTPRRRVTHVVFLERSTETKVEQTDFTTALAKAMNLNRYEFNYCRSPLLIAYDYFNPELRLCEAPQLECDKFSELLQNADQRLTISTANATDYADLVLQQLGQPLHRHAA